MLKINKKILVKLNFLKIEQAFVIIQNPDENTYVTGRQQAAYFFGPFNKAIAVRVKIFLVTHIKGFGLVFKAIKIKVINFACSPGIFIYDGESRAAGWPFHAQMPAKRFDKSGFTRPHIAVKEEDLLAF